MSLSFSHSSLLACAKEIYKQIKLKRGQTQDLGAQGPNQGTCTEVSARYTKGFQQRTQKGLQTILLEATCIFIFLEANTSCSERIEKQSNRACCLTY